MQLASPACCCRTHVALYRISGDTGRLFPARAAAVNVVLHAWLKLTGTAEHACVFIKGSGHVEEDIFKSWPWIGAATWELRLHAAAVLCYQMQSEHARLPVVAGV